MTTTPPLTFFPNSKELALSNLQKRTDLANKQIQDLQSQMESAKDEAFEAFVSKSKLMQQILQPPVHDNIASLCGYLNEEIAALVSLQNDLTRLVLYYNSRMTALNAQKPKQSTIVEESKNLPQQQTIQPVKKEPSPKIAVSKEQSAQAPKIPQQPIQKTSPAVSPAVSPRMDVDELFGPSPVQVRQNQKDEDEINVRSPQDNADQKKKTTSHDDEKEGFHIAVHVPSSVLSDVATVGSEAGLDIAKMSDLDDFTTDDNKSDFSNGKKPKKFTMDDDDFINEIIPKTKPIKNPNTNPEQMFSFGNEGEIIVKTNKILNLFDAEPSPTGKDEENQSDDSKESADSAPKQAESKPAENPKQVSPKPMSFLEDM